MVLPGSEFFHTDGFHVKGLEPRVFVRESQLIQNKQVWSKCHMINNLLEISKFPIPGKTITMTCLSTTLTMSYIQV